MVSVDLQLRQGNTLCCTKHGNVHYLHYYGGVDRRSQWLPDSFRKLNKLYKDIWTKKNSDRINTRTPYCNVYFTTSMFSTYTKINTNWQI